MHDRHPPGCFNEYGGLLQDAVRSKLLEYAGITAIDFKDEQDASTPLSDRNCACRLPNGFDLFRLRSVQTIGGNPSLQRASPEECTTLASPTADVRLPYVSPAAISASIGHYTEQLNQIWGLFRHGRKVRTRQAHFRLQKPLAAIILVRKKPCFYNNVGSGE
jgi:hypothetical protein